jgi:hypothetical protein
MVTLSIKYHLYLLLFLPTFFFFFFFDCPSKPLSPLYTRTESLTVHGFFLSLLPNLHVSKKIADRDSYSFLAMETTTERVYLITTVRLQRDCNIQCFAATHRAILLLLACSDAAATEVTFQPKFLLRHWSCGHHSSSLWHFSFKSGLLKQFH